MATIMKVSKSSKALRATLTMMGKGWMMGKVKGQPPPKKVVVKQCWTFLAIKDSLYILFD